MASSSVKGTDIKACYKEKRLDIRYFKFYKKGSTYKVLRVSQEKGLSTRTSISDRHVSLRYGSIISDWMKFP